MSKERLHVAKRCRRGENVRLEIAKLQASFDLSEKEIGKEFQRVQEYLDIDAMKAKHSDWPKQISEMKQQLKVIQRFTDLNSGSNVFLHDTLSVAALNDTLRSFCEALDNTVQMDLNAWDPTDVLKTAMDKSKKQELYSKLLDVVSQNEQAVEVVEGMQCDHVGRLACNFLKHVDGKVTGGKLLNTVGSTSILEALDIHDEATHLVLVEMGGGSWSGDVYSHEVLELVERMSAGIDGIPNPYDSPVIETLLQAALEFSKSRAC